jgi:phospholipid/cholesterol/gamma-HCH transport system substrate-binding protein
MAEPRNLEIKAALLLVFTTLLIAGSVLYLLYARGAFEATQQLVLVTDDAEGVVPGMDMTFSGFPIGRVRGVELGETGNVRITLDVAKKDAHWLRTSSVFTLERGLVGGTAIRAFTGILTAPPLPDGAERPVLRGDFNEEAGRVIGAAKDVLDNLNRITAENSDLNRSMGNLEVFTQKLQSKRGALAAVFGNDQDAQKLVDAVQRANAAMAEIQRLAQSGQRLVSNADTRVFGRNGIADDAQASLKQLHTLLTDARGSLQRVDAVLTEAQGVAGNVRTATADLGTLRGEVEANLRKIEDMINDLQRKWPFAKERKVDLP